MEQEEKQLDEKEALQLIANMIRSTKDSLSDNSFYMLLWGWLVFIATTSFFILMKMQVSYAAAVWLLMPLGAVVTIIYTWKKHRRERAKSYIGQIISYLWIALGVGMFVVLGFQQQLQLATYPMMMTLYGIGLFVTGGAIRFRPVIIAGVLCWGFAIGAMFTSFENQTLILAACVFTCYIIPGHMLRRKETMYAVSGA